MGKVVSPEKSELAKLKTPLEKGEKLVLELFERSLSDDWEIYVQPHLNGCRPDFILLNPNVGVGVFEVKDWDLNSMEYYVKGDKYPKLWATRNGKSFHVPDPIRQSQRYKREIYEIYCPRLNERFGIATITAGVIFPFADDEQLERLFAPLRSSQRLFPQYDTLAGSSAIESGNMRKIFPESGRITSRIMSEDLAADLRSWLIEPDYSAEQREPLDLDTNQRGLINNRTESGFRRVRGPAGSGKSLVLAARAAKLVAEGKDVLVVSYNITLLHYLRDLCSRYSVGHPNMVTWLNFHHWCKRVVEDLGASSEYKSLWKNHFETDGTVDGEVDDVLSLKVPQLVLRHLRGEHRGDTPTYDAILVDEGQDFSPIWWSALRNICKDGGEMLLAADVTQDVYGTATKWTDEAMQGAGFRGAWSELPTSYRIPPEIFKYVIEFAEKLLPEDIRLIPKAPENQMELDLSPCFLKWVQVDRKSSVDTCVNELLEIIRKDEDASRAMSDLTLLTDNVVDGLNISKKLEDMGIKTVHTFSSSTGPNFEKPKEDRRKKLGFWKGDSRVKITTFHSFKGWEGRLMVLHITRARTPKEYALVYTGLTRLKKHPLGSCLTVVCSEQYFSGFGKHWPVFVGPN